MSRAALPVRIGWSLANTAPVVTDGWLQNHSQTQKYQPLTGATQRLLVLSQPPHGSPAAPWTTPAIVSMLTWKSAPDVKV